jgi:hypothetical protein
LTNSVASNDFKSSLRMIPPHASLKKDYYVKKMYNYSETFRMKLMGNRFFALDILYFKHGESEIDHSVIEKKKLDVVNYFYLETAKIISLSNFR